MAIVKKTYKQIAEYLNKHVPQYLGKDALVAEDLSNIVDIGQKLQDIDGALVGGASLTADSFAAIVKGAM